MRQCLRWHKWSRRTHFWGASFIAVPFLIILVSGTLLQLKKEFRWIQPSMNFGSGQIPSIPFDRILEITQTIPEAQVSHWQDVDRIDVRPQDGIMKVLSKNHWEIQLDHQTGKVLQVAYRRSDLIESIHDGSFFHKKVKRYVFLPVATILLLMWTTGIYMFVLPFRIKRRFKKNQ